MRPKRRPPFWATVRFYAGCLAGIAGFGIMGGNVFPFNGWHMVLGFVVLCVGAILAIGVVASRGGPPTKSAKVP